MSGPSDAPPATSALVGRDDELAALEGAVQAALAGHGPGLLVVGEAGIGKSRLVAEAAGRTRDTGGRVVTATAWETGGAPAHWHWVQLLRRLAAGHDPASLVRALGDDGPELARLVPDLRAGVRLTPPSGPEGDDPRFRMYDAVASFLRRSGRHRPLLLVLEDVHAGDLGTLALLRFVLGEWQDEPIAVVATARDPAIEAMPPDLAASLAELARAMPTLPLGGLGRPGVESLLGPVVGPAEAARLAPDIHRRSGGNPLFVAELAYLVAGGAGPEAGARLPAGIRTVLERRLATVPDRSLEVLRVAAVVGEEFSVALVEQAAGLPRSDVLDGLDDALRAHLVAPGPGAGPGFSFTHALLREVAYEQLPLAARAQAHRRVAEALERRPGVEPAPAELAHHFLAGAMAVEDGKAAAYAERAGRRAADQLAYEDAAQHFRGALAALDLGGADQSRRAPVLLALGDACLRAGDLPGARAAFEQAAGLARRDNRPDLLARAALGLGSGMDGFEVRLFDHAQLTLLDEARQALGPEPSPLRAWVLARLSVALTFAESAARRLALADEAVATARSTGDDGALAHALAARCDATSGPEHVDARRDAATEIIRLARAAGDRGMELLGRRHRLIALLEGGDIGAVDAEIDSYEMVAADLGQALYQWYVPLWRGMRALMDGRLPAAREYQQAATAVGSRARSHNAALNAEVLAWNTLLKEGHAAEAGHRLARQLELADGIYGDPFWVALVAPAEYPAEARAALDRLAAHDFAELPRDAIWLAAMTYAADACGVLADAGLAGRLYELVVPFEERFAVDAIGAACYGSMARPLGVLAGVLGRRADAEAHFGVALDAHRACGASALVAETLHCLGVARGAVGNHDGAAAALEEARSLYRSLHMDHRAGQVGGSDSLTGVNEFRHQGEYWTLTYAGRTVRVADAKGLRDIAALLARPGRELHVADLIAAGDPAAGREGDRIRTAVLRSGPAGAVLDARARAQYRSRLLDLREELEEAEANHDLGRADAARAEMDAIAGELAVSLGLGGRSRSGPDAGERARKAVGQRIRNALRRLDDLHPELAAHLDRSLRTGRFCSYSPERPTGWRVDSIL